MRSIRTPLLVFVLAGVAIGTPALAQPAAPVPPVTYPAPCDASKVTKADVDRAHTVFLSGRQYLDESNYDKAISYFNDAYSIDCSVHAILPIIATAYERKGDKAEAIRALEEYLKRAPSAPDRERVERRIKNLNDQLAHEAPSPPPPAASTAAPPQATAAPSATAVEPPPAPVTPAPAPAPAELPVHHRSTTVPWIVTGVGGALTIAGAVMLGLGISDVSSAQSECHGHTNCAHDVADKGNTGLALEDAGIPIAIMGLASAIGGAIWVVVNSSSPATSTGIYVSPVVAPGYAGLTLRSQL